MDGFSATTVVDSVAHGALIRVLQACSVFRTLPDDELVSIATKSERVTVDRKEALGALSDGFLYVVGRGRVRLLRTCGDRELTLDYVGPGEVFGEQGLFDSRPEGQAVALEPVETVRVPLALVKRLLGSNVAFASSLLGVVATRRRASENRIHAMLSRDVESRVAEFILDVAARHGIPDPRGILVEFKFTHQEIADFVGSTRETVTLVMGSFKKSGVVLPDHRRALIKDVEALRSKI